MNRLTLLAPYLILLLMACGDNPGGANSELEGEGDNADATVDGGGDAVDGGPEDTSDACFDPRDFSVTLVSTHPDGCDGLECSSTGTFFRNECGCGCVEDFSSCTHDWSDPLLQRVYDGSSPRCDDSDWTCVRGGQRIEGSCGCGCSFEPPTCPDPAHPQVGYTSDDPFQQGSITVCAGNQATFAGLCGGGCIGQGPEYCSIDWDAPRYELINESPDVCRQGEWTCPEGATAVSDSCGCGCDLSEVCPEVRARSLRYVSEDPAACATTNWECPGGEPFTSVCGCGCEYSEISDEEAAYNGRLIEDPGTCRLVDFECPEGWVPWNSGSGCGCRIAACREQVIQDPWGIGDFFRLGNTCESFVACSPLSLEESGLEAVMTELFGSADCEDGPTAACLDHGSHCRISGGEVTAALAVDLCAVSVEESVDRIVCEDGL